MADKELNIKLGAKDAGMTAALNKVQGSVDAISKKVGDFSKVFAIGAFADRAFGAITAGLEEFRSLQQQVEDGSMSMTTAVETAFSSFARQLPVIGAAFKLGEEIGDMISSGASAAEMDAANKGMAKMLLISAQAKSQFESLEKLGDKAAEEAKLAGLSPEDREKRIAQNSAVDQFKQAQDIRDSIPAGSPFRDRADELLKEFDTNVEAKLDASVKAIEQKAADEAAKLAERAADEAAKSAEQLKDLQTQIIIDRLELEGSTFESQKVKIAADLEKKLSKESDPAMQAALKDLAEIQLSKINRDMEAEIEKSIAEGAGIVPDTPESQPQKTARQRAAFFQSQFLTGATGASRAETEQKNQTKAINQMSEDIRMLRETFGENIIVAAVKGGIRGR